MTKAPILLIDDDTELLEVYEKIFRLKGFQVLTCSSSLDTLKLIRDRTFSVVVSDIIMPKMNGMELLDAIKKSPLSSMVEITEEDAGLHFLMKLATTLSDEELIRRAQREGVRISCLSQYYPQQREGAEHILIINYSGIESDRIAEAIARLSRCLR